MAKKGSKLTTEHRAKIALAAKNRKSDHFAGKAHTEETKARIAETLRNRNALINELLAQTSNTGVLK